MSIPENYPVQYLKTVGPKRAGLLKRLGIETVRDLLYHFPRNYEDRRKITQAYKCVHGEQATLTGTVIDGEDLKPRRNLTITKLAIHDGRGVFYAVWFNQPHIKKQFPPGSRILVTGKVERAFGQIRVQVVDFELLGEHEPLHGGRIVPLYPLTEQINQRFLRSIVRTAIDEGAEHIKEFLPYDLRNRYSFPDLPSALHQIHFPDDLTQAQQARHRFIFEELFLFQMMLLLSRRQVTRKLKPHRYLKDVPLVKKFLEGLPFQLTAAQTRAWSEISRDMDQPYPVNRLLQGDVGSGKTVVSILFLLKAAGSGLQGALMAPTEILAEQHFLNLRRFLEPLGVEVGLLSGSIKKKERDELLARLREGKVPIVVGTHALIQNDVDFQCLAAVVIDEQHRFGVRQRATLQQKGYLPDVLVMTATPIPRTLALTLYGDLEVSTIAELPPGRQPVHTCICPPDKLEEACLFIREQVKKGLQGYIVCPLVEESEKIEIQSAVELMEELSRGTLQDCRLGLLHGRLKAEEKERVMDAFREGEIDVLVSTTVIEVGVDVPTAAVIVVLDAERFGLAQLHQLRGRVGRGTHKSYCILVSSAHTAEARARLEAMASTMDGFALAEKDLQLRGPGELAGTRQSGLPEFKIADLLRDWRLLEIARQEAINLVEKDPLLNFPEHLPLRRELRSRFPEAGRYLEIG